MKDSFKLIAVRILGGCSSDICKCLKYNKFYYLCNDYLIKEDGATIMRASRYHTPLTENFFSLSDKEEKVNINLQAIVGKNGDGKSSLIEIILRLLNNFAISKQMGDVENLSVANKVCAELYYFKDGSFYCLEEKEGDVDAMRLWKYELNNDAITYTRCAEVTGTELKENFFYTLSSNYSHYAYNTVEFQNESDGLLEKNCWLHNIFHKNDGYQVPLSLHPFRIKGNIDINRERELTKPRLVSTFVKSMLSAEKNGGTFEVNGKKLAGLKLTDPRFSKFQERTLKDFFKAHKNTRLLQTEIDTLQNFDVHNEKESDVSLLVEYTKELQAAYKKYFGHKSNRKFYDLMKKWMRTNNLLEENTDVNTFLNLLISLADSYLLDVELRELLDICNKWEEYSDFNLCQIQRIELIDDICDQWHKPGIILGSEQFITVDITPEVLLKAYDSLSDREKCLHYLVYKTISIFETYESYDNPCSTYATLPFFFGGNPKPGMTYDKWQEAVISRPFAKLSQDWLFGSHITLKLEQTYNFYKQGRDSTYTLYPPKAKNDNLSDGTLFFTNMSDADKMRLYDRGQLPPAIYNWDVIFWANGSLVTLESFSSGEKQRFFGLAAIIYHLQNIDSVAVQKFHYHAVNLILEEIELYFHPEWQRTFCNDLMKMTRESGLHNINSINILFVTHSPYILSDIPKTNVLFLKEGQPVNDMQENTFGANINSLLKNGFFMPSLPMGEFAHEKINQLFGKLHSGEFDRTTFEEIRSEIMMIGEPYIRQQLMSLFNMYSQLDASQIKEYIRQFILEREHHD